MTQPFGLSGLNFFAGKKSSNPCYDKRAFFLFFGTRRFYQPKKGDYKMTNKTNTVTLTGNMGSEARIIEQEEKNFAVFSLATTDSYKDEKGEWVEKSVVWHNLIAFSPKLIAQLKNLKKGTRLKVTGSLSYRPFEVQDESGKTITKKECSVIAHQVEQAPLVKKSS